jgi:hypothetical protein
LAERVLAVLPIGQMKMRGGDFTIGTGGPGQKSFGPHRCEAGLGAVAR